jgi:hypothetical protein
VSLIAATRTQAGLALRCKLDQRPYPTAVKVTDAQMATIHPAKKRE